MGGRLYRPADNEVTPMANNYNPTTSTLFATATTAIDRATMTAARIGSTDKPSLRETRFSHDVNAINLDEPPKFSDLFEGADNANAIIAQLDDQVDEWLAKYFPAVNGGLKSGTEDWCIGVISGVKPFGIDSTVFDLVWHKARDRAYRTTRSEQRTLEASFSARGFSLPPGALVDVLTASEQRATDAILDVNREQAIKDADIKVELLKHATSIAAQLKTGILNTSAEFFKAYYNVYGLDNDTARIRAQAYNAYYSALATYYNVEVSWEELRMKAESTTAETDLALDRNRINLYAENGAAAAHAQASRGFADIAASASAAASTLVAEIETGGA